MQVVELLDRFSADYKVSQHRPAFSAQRLAHEEHVHGMNVAKPVVVTADGRDYVCVLPACCRIDFDALRTVLGADHVELADEDHVAELFADCELGAEPPFGTLFEMPTLMDDTLGKDGFLVCQAGTHEKAVRLSLNDYQKLEKPKVMHFSYHLH